MCASDAAIIILLHPEHVEVVARAEARKAAAVAALTTLKHFNRQSLIVQVCMHMPLSMQDDFFCSSVLWA